MVKEKTIMKSEWSLTVSAHILMEKNMLFHRERNVHSTRGLG